MTAEAHSHHWLLGQPANGITHGACACGAERDWDDRLQTMYEMAGKYREAREAATEARAHRAFRGSKKS